jgi:hypothetical protein
MILDNRILREAAQVNAKFWHTNWSGLRQLEPESAADVFKLADFVERLRNDEQAPSHLSKTPVQAAAG